MNKSSCNVLPEWMVLFMDALVYLNACLFGYLSFTSYHQIEFIPSELILGSMCFTGLGLLTSYICKNHVVKKEANIAIEAISIFKTILLTLALLSISQYIISITFDTKIFYGSIACLSIVIGFAILGSLTLRLVMRQAVDYLNRQNTIQHKFLIVGNDSTSKSTRTVIQKLGFPLQFIQAYFTENPAGMGKKIDNAPIFSKLVDFEKIVKQHEITDIVLSAEVGSVDRKRAYIDECLNLSIRPSILKPKDPWAITKVNGLGIKKVSIEDYLAEDQAVLNDLKLYQYINQQTILIAGAAGSLGREICRQLLYLNPSHIILLDVAEESLVTLEKKIKKLRLRTTISSVIIDINNRRGLRTIFEKFNPQIVFHAAFSNDPLHMEVYSEEAVKAHIYGTKNLAYLSKEFKVDRFILVSSEQAVNPRNIIGASKRMAEQYIQNAQHQSGCNKKTRFIIVRHGEILGVNDKVIHNIKKEIKLGKGVNIHHPQSIKSFCSLAEAGKFILTTSILGQGGETYVLQKNNAIKMVDLVKKIIQLSPIHTSTEIKVHYNKNNQPIKKSLTFNSAMEYLLPTTYSDIFLAVPLEKSYININENIEQLLRIVQEEDEISLLKFFKGIMPEFVSNKKYIELSYRKN